LTASAPAAIQSPLEATLHEVHATLIELLDAAQEQHAAVAAHDLERIERVTRQQERLASRLARAEARRIELLHGAPLAQALSQVSRDEADRIQSLQATIATLVSALKARQSQTGRLLNDTIELTDRTIVFLQRLLAPGAPAYLRTGRASAGGSLLVDSHA
jgi:flagellar biosynthesis/type III secretory pathway chaperone